VEAHRNDGEPEREQDRASVLATIDREYPCWHAWPGVAGLIYARRPNSSPALVVRSVTLDGLRQKIEEAETKAGLR
jgi:hypothetical protein